MNSWFDLVKEKNQLLRTENKLMIEQRELQLQVIEYEDNCTSSSVTTDQNDSFTENYQTTLNSFNPDIPSPPFCQNFWV